MILEQIQIQKCQNIHKGTKYVRNPHILCTLPALHFFGHFKLCRDFIWVGYCLNSFITLRRWSNDFRKKFKCKNNKKINKGTKNVRNLHILRTLPILQFFELFKIFWDFIQLGYCLNKLITLNGCSNDVRISGKNHTSKIFKNQEGYEKCEEFSHSSYPPHSPLL